MDEWINCQAKCNHTALVVNAWMSECVCMCVCECMCELDGHELSDGCTKEWKGYLNEWMKCTEC